MHRFDSAGQAMPVPRPLSPRHPGPRPAVDRLLQPLKTTAPPTCVAPNHVKRVEIWRQERGDCLEAPGDGWAVYRRTPPALDWLASSSGTRLKLFTPLSITVGLVLLLFFGRLGNYYYHRFTWCHPLEDPHYDLLIVKKDDNSELAFFRKKTTPDVIDPARMQLDALVKIRKESQKGISYPEHCDQRLKEMGEQLVEIMDVAKLRQIPRQYAKAYEAEVLVGISEIYRSWLAFQDALEANNPQDKERFIQESIKYSKSADLKLAKARARYL